MLFGVATSRLLVIINFCAHAYMYVCIHVCVSVVFVCVWAGFFGVFLSFCARGACACVCVSSVSLSNSFLCLLARLLNKA